MTLRQLDRRGHAGGPKLADPAKAQALLGAKKIVVVTHAARLQKVPPRFMNRS
jgi:hypothetical protein